MSIENVLYRASAKATGGRDGRATSSDGALDIKLSTPTELGGAGGIASNPEQLFAAGYSACFLGAMKFVGNRDKITIPADTAVDGSRRHRGHRCDSRRIWHRSCAEHRAART